MITKGSTHRSKGIKKVETSSYTVKFIIDEGATLKRSRLRRQLKNPSLLENYFEFKSDPIQRVNMFHLVTSTEKNASQLTNNEKSPTSPSFQSTMDAQTSTNQYETEIWCGLLPLVNVSEINMEWEQLCKRDESKSSKVIYSYETEQAQIVENFNLEE